MKCFPFFHKYEIVGVKSDAFWFKGTEREVAPAVYCKCSKCGKRIVKYPKAEDQYHQLNRTREMYWTMNGVISRGQDGQD